MDIFLVRHGEAAASWGQASDPGLSALGQTQARDAAAALRSRLVDDAILWSSPLARAQETAEPLARQLDKPIEINDVFREVPSPVPLEDRQGWLRQFMQQTWAEQGDELHSWRDRAWDTLLQTRQCAVVFTHFLVINAVVGRIKDSPQTLCFYPDNGSITHLRHAGTRLELVTLGRELTTVVN